MSHSHSEVDLSKEADNILEKFKKVLHFLGTTIQQKQMELRIRKERGDSLAKQGKLEKLIRELETIANFTKILVENTKVPLAKRLDKYNKTLKELASNSDDADNAGQLAGLAQSGASAAVAIPIVGQILGPLIKALTFIAKAANQKRLENQAERREGKLSTELHASIKTLQRSAFEAHIAMLTIIFQDHHVSRNANYQNYIRALKSLSIFIEHSNETTTMLDLPTVVSNIEEFVNVFMEKLHLKPNEKLSSATEKRIFQALAILVGEYNKLIMPLEKLQNFVSPTMLEETLEQRNTNQRIIEVLNEEESLKMMLKDSLLEPVDRVMTELRRILNTYKMHSIAKQLEAKKAVKEVSSSSPPSHLITHRIRDKKQLHGFELKVLRAQFSMLFNLVSDSAKKKRPDLMKLAGELGLLEESNDELAAGDQKQQSHSAGPQAQVEPSSSSSSSSSSEDSSLSEDVLKPDFRVPSSSSLASSSSSRMPEQPSSPKQSPKKPFQRVYYLSSGGGDEEAKAKAFHLAQLERELEISQQRYIEKHLDLRNLSEKRAALKEKNDNPQLVEMLKQQVTDRLEEIKRMEESQKDRLKEIENLKREIKAEQEKRSQPRHGRGFRALPTTPLHMPRTIDGSPPDGSSPEDSPIQSPEDKEAEGGRPAGSSPEGSPIQSPEDKEAKGGRRRFHGGKPKGLGGLFDKAAGSGAASSQSSAEGPKLDSPNPEDSKENAEEADLQLALALSQSHHDLSKDAKKPLYPDERHVSLDLSQPLVAPSQSHENEDLGLPLASSESQPAEDQKGRGGVGEQCSSISSPPEVVLSSSLPDLNSGSSSMSPLSPRSEAFEDPDPVIEDEKSDEEEEQFQGLEPKTGMSAGPRQPEHVGAFEDFRDPVISEEEELYKSDSEAQAGSPPSQSGSGNFSPEHKAGVPAGQIQPSALVQSQSSSSQSAAASSPAQQEQPVAAGKSLRKRFFGSKAQPHITPLPQDVKDQMLKFSKHKHICKLIENVHRSVHEQDHEKLKTGFRSLQDEMSKVLGKQNPKGVPADASLKLAFDEVVKKYQPEYEKAVAALNKKPK